MKVNQLGKYTPNQLDLKAFFFFVFFSSSLFRKVLHSQFCPLSKEESWKRNSSIGTSLMYICRFACRCVCTRARICMHIYIFAYVFMFSVFFVVKYLGRVGYNYVLKYESVVRDISHETSMWIVPN